MKYMNKQLALLTADNMLKSAKAKIEAKQNELNAFCEQVVMKHIPDKEFNIISQLPEGWVRKENNFYFSSPYGNGYGIPVKTVKPLPCKAYREDVKVSKDEFETVKKLVAEIKEMKEKLSQLSGQIIETLVKLRTIEKIKKEFPAAYKHLPKDSMSGKNIIALPVEKILQKIEDFPV